MTDKRNITNHLQEKPMQQALNPGKGNFLRELFAPPAFKDISKQRLASLQHKILLGLLFVTFLGCIVIAITWSGEPSLYGMAIEIVQICLFLFELSSLHQGRLERVSWIIVGVMYGVFISTTALAKIGFVSILELTLVLSLAGFLLKPLWVIVSTVFVVLTLLAISFISPLQNPSDMLYIILVLGLEGTLLTVASHTLEQAFADADRSTQNIVHANQDLQNMTINLEQRVEERTKALSRQAIRLQAASDVSRSISSILNADELIQKAVDLIHNRFDVYYVGLFLLDEQQHLAILKAGTGETGIKLVASGQKIEINDSTIIGWCIRHKEAQIDSRVSEETTRFSNPLLPRTRSELALPLISQGQVIGAISIQSEQESAFSLEDINILQTTADQLANGIEKARLYEQIQQRAIELDKARETADSAKNDAEKARSAAEEANSRLAAQIWQTTGQTSLNDKMRGEQDLTTLANNIIQHLCQYLKIENGAIYILEDKILHLTGTYAYRRKSLEQQYQIGEDLIGQGALEKEIVMYQIPEEYIAISLRQGQLLPKFRLVAPVAYNQQVSGVVTLESMTEFTAVQKDFLMDAMESIAIAFTTAQARARVNELFTKTRQQTEELQAQEERLRATNEELQAQSESLRALKR